MSLENALINEPNITVGTQDNSLTNVFTDVINIDGFTIFRQRNNFFKRDEKTKQISKLAKGSSQVHRWYKIKDKQDIVYLNGDLILDNLVFTNGNISCNIDISRYNSNIDNSAINFLGLGYGSISDQFNDRNTESQKIIVNDAWKEIDDSSFFCSKNLIIFKWQSYLTFFTGILLLIIIYYANSKILMMDSRVNANITPLMGIVISILSIIGSWKIYDLLCKSKLINYKIKRG